MFTLVLNFVVLGDRRYKCNPLIYALLLLLVMLSNFFLDLPQVDHCKMYKMKNTTSILAIVVALMLLLADVHAQDCNPDREINDCYPALSSKGSPSSLCCDELRRHNNCLCEYVDINRHILPPNYQFLRRIAKTCSVFFPFCPV
ncbi:hypothetical protein L2E82_11751 [Cichorium intybus]|uniref:Uncharacterized protein n=1 Tax=Cichorium intybus TaxID=13427 RepID=A0ACB9GF97_CICIN|nr:hypothetical protein L2E82_11751 [Cichorium intybus]